MSDESDSSCSEEDENILSSSITDYQFFQACENGDVHKVKAILTAKPEWLNKRDRYGETPLFISISKKHWELFSFLMSFPNVDVNCPKNNGFTPLIVACDRGFIEQVKVLLDRPEINVNAQETNWYKTAFHYACEKGNIEVVRLLLLNKSLELNVVSSKGGTVLELMNSKSNIPFKAEICSLIENWYCENISSIDINRKDENGTTVLMRAIQHRQFQFVQKLLSQPTLDINAQNKTGESALFFIQSGDKELLHMFLSDGRVDVNIRNKDGNSFLYCRVMYETEDCLKMICSHPKIDINCVNNHHETVLHQICSYHSYVGFYSKGQNKDDLVAQKLLKFFLTLPSINVNMQDKNGDTPLHKACLFGNKALILLLLDYPEIDANIQNQWNISPCANILREKCYDYNEDIKSALKVLKAILQDWNDLHRFETLPFFTEVAASFFLSSNAGPATSPLLYRLILAIKDGNLSEVQNILQNHSNLLNETVTYKVMNGSFLSTNVVTYTTTPLMIACAYNRRDIVAYLISFSDEININFQDEILGNTPLMISALHGYHEIVKILLQLPNIDVNLSRNESGDNDTSLHLAAKFGQLDVFLELLAHPKINAGKANKNKVLPGDIIFSSHYAMKDDNITTRYYNGCVVQGVSNSYIMRDALKNWLANHPEVQYLIAWEGTTNFFNISNILRDHPHLVNLPVDEITHPNALIKAINMLSQGKSVEVSILLELLRIPELDINFQDKHGETALHKICRCYDRRDNIITIMNAILNHPQISVNIQNQEGYSPLHLVCSRGSTNILKTLLSSKHTIDTSLKDKNGHTAYDICKNLDNMEEFYGGGYTALFQGMLKEYMKKHPASTLLRLKAKETPSSRSSVASTSVSTARSTTTGTTTGLKSSSVKKTAAVVPSKLAVSSKKGPVEEEIDEGMLADLDAMSTVSSLSSASLHVPVKSPASRSIIRPTGTSARSATSTLPTAPAPAMKGPAAPTSSSTRVKPPTPPANTSLKDPAKQKASATIARVPRAKNDNYDFFLTHAWGVDHTNHLKVSRINTLLKKKGFNTWFDEDRLTGDILYQITSAIEKSKVILVFITKDYHDKVNSINERDYCLLEFRHAMNILGPQGMIPIVMESSMKNTREWKGRVGAALASKMYYDFSEIIDWADDSVALEESFEKFLPALRNHLLGSH